MNQNGTRSDSPIPLRDERRPHWQQLLGAHPRRRLPAFALVFLALAFLFSAQRTPDAHTQGSDRRTALSSSEETGAGLRAQATRELNEALALLREQDVGLYRQQVGLDAQVEWSTDVHEGADEEDEGAARVVNLEDGEKTVMATVQEGDSLSEFLERHKVPYSTALRVSAAAESVYDLSRKIQSGRELTLVFGDDGDLVGLVYPVTPTTTLHMTADEDGRFAATMVADAEVDPQGNLFQPPVPKPLEVADVAEEASPAPVVRSEDSAAVMFRKAHRRTQETVRRGDHLSGLFDREGIPANTAMAINQAVRPMFDLAKKLRVGKKFEFAFNESNQLVGVTYPLDDDHTLWVLSDGNGGFNPRIQKRTYKVHVKSVSGIINGSLFTASRRAGLSHAMAARLAGLFEWDVDFARDIHPGDRFTVVYEELHDEAGRLVRDGEILSARFVNQGRSHQSVRYTDPQGNTGYFNPDGQTLAKMFIRAPVDFTRISSGFSLKRKHPVFGFTRAHKGVDYAAPTGTPVRAAGAGQVIFRGYKGGFGKLILVRHNAKYVTAYAHLSEFNKGLKVGSTVRQGQIIGAVGQTGAATGPHLHYEVRVNGQQVNPLSVQPPSGNTIQKRWMADFKSKTRPYLALLEKAETPVLAQSAAKGGVGTSRN
ncbi:MAG: peptidoglycan DD-metalloendopeptidase family protein [Magnetococcus sp. WYHC-3]